MPVPVHCGLCKKPLLVGEEFAGKAVKCPNCGASMVVPGGSGGLSAKGWLLVVGCIAAGVVLMGLVLALSGGRRGAPRRPAAVKPNRPPQRINPRVNANGNRKSLPARRPVNPPPRVNRKTPPPPPKGGTKFETPETNPVTPDTPKRISTVKWKYEVDAPPERVTFEDRKVEIPVPGPTFSLDSLVFAASPSPFVAVGRNASRDDVREFRDLRSGRRIGRLAGFRMNMRLTALSPGGLYFAAKNSGDKQVLIWDVKKGKGLVALPLEKSLLMKTFAFAGDNRFVASAYNSPLWVWGLPDGKPLRSIEMPKNVDSNEFTVSPTGRNVALYDDDKDRVRLCDLDTGQVVGEAIPPIEPYGCEGLAFSPDGKELAALFYHSRANHLVVWDLQQQGRMVEHVKIDERLDKKTSSLNQPVVQWFPDGQRWLLHGEALVQRKVGPIWYAPKRPRDAIKSPVVVLDDERVAVVVGDFKLAVLQVEKLPQEDIARYARVMAAGGLAVDSNLPALTKAERTGMKSISMSKANVQPWSVKADPAPKADAGLINRPVEVPQDGRRIGGLLIAKADAARAVVPRYDFDPHGTTPPRRSLDAPRLPAVTLGVYDVAAGKRLDTVDIPFKTEAIAISPDGKRVLMRLIQGQGRIDVWDLDEKKHVAAWRPLFSAGKKPTGGLRTIGLKAAAFIDSDHVLTLSSESNLVMWKLPDCRAVYQITDARHALLSPGGKYLAVLTNSGVRFFDAMTAQPHGELKTRAAPLSGAFHPDGRRFAAITVESYNARLTVCNLPDGEVATEFPIPKAGHQMHWCGENYVLVNNSWLIDVPHKMVVWSYKPSRAGHAAGTPDGRHWLVGHPPNNSREVYLGAVELPEAEAAQKLAAAELKPNYLLKPGDEISLHIGLSNIAGRANFARQVYQNVAQRCQEHGMRVIETTAPVQMVFTMEQGSGSGKTMELEIRGLGRIRGERVSVAEQSIDCKIRYIRGGRTLLEHKTSPTNRLFGYVELREGQSADEVLSKRMYNAAASYFLSYKPVSHILPKDAENGLGQSTISPVP